MAIAAAVTVAAVVRLRHARAREEIEIMQLVGASIASSAAPVRRRGLLQGGIGAIAAVLLAPGAGYARLERLVGGRS
jgi:cell division protein FtsX